MPEEIDTTNQNDPKLSNEPKIVIGKSVPDEVQDLPQGDALSIEKTYEITSSREVKFILLVGESKSGKSTLVTTIYHMFNKGPFAGYFFAGSETLRGFEQRAYNARTLSYNSSPTMPKTGVGVLDLLHLRIYDPKKLVFKDLLISDFSGEDYKSVIGNVDLAKNDFGIIKAADQVVLLIDGDLLSRNACRNEAAQNALLLLKTINDAGLITKNVCIDVLISKYDLILQRAKLDNSINDFVIDLKRKFKQNFQQVSNQLRILDIAAMPDQTGDVALGYGLDELVLYWTNQDTKADLRFDILANNGSEFNSFASRNLEVKN